MVLAGLVWRLVFPTLSRGAEAGLADRPWRSLGIGAPGERLLRATGRGSSATPVRDALALTAALLALMLIGWLPWLGWLVSLAAGMAGIGSLVDRLVVRPPAREAA